jgi:uncharacterized protein (DUF305 family)
MRKLAIAIVATLVPVAVVAQTNAGAVISALMDANHMMMMGMDAVKPTGDADKDFVAMMIPHHQGAIDMAKVELQYGKDPMLKAMAQSIVTSQQKEIDDMKAWQTGRP